MNPGCKNQKCEVAYSRGTQCRAQICTQPNSRKSKSAYDDGSLLAAPIYPGFGSVAIKQNAKMHENATTAENSQCERYSLLLSDLEFDNGEDVIEIVAMENGNHTADLPRRTQQEQVRNSLGQQLVGKVLKNVF